MEGHSQFGIGILAQLTALKTQEGIDTRLKIKFSLTRRLYDRGLDRDAILNLLTLPKDLAIRYNDYIHQLEEERAVAYITTAEQIGMEKGIRYERTMLSNFLTRRFGDLSPDIKRKLEQADPDTLLSWGNKIFDAKMIEDVFVE